jgi:membrane protein
VLATLLWLLFSLGFRFYVTNFADYNETYGAIGGVIVLLLWFYASGLAILIGAELNSEIEHASPYGKDPGEKAPGARKKIGLAAWRAWRARQKRHEPAGPPPPEPRPATAPVHAARSRPIDMVLGSLIAGAIALVRGRSRTRS